jgi:Cof subfamily protein (haloacid dehalogenase superfamily)
MLNDKNIAYTLATGRTMLSAQRIVEGHDFSLPQIFNNGVTIWDPQTQQLTLENLLNNAELSTVIELAFTKGVTPFINVIDKHQHSIYHAETRHDVERELIDKYFSSCKAKVLPISALPSNSQVTNISMISTEHIIKDMWLALNNHDNLIAYSGPALEGDNFWWLEVHHRNANKGSAVTNLKHQLDASKVICFGDGDNDLSMFALADECYAPENAKDEVKQSATAVIGHNHKDGIAHFLRERFSL